MASTSSCHSGGSSIIFDDYLVVNPEKASLLDLPRLLLSKNSVPKEEFLHTPKGLVGAAEDHLEQLRYRWMVVFTLLIQKIFILLKKPVATFGALLESFLNIVSVNEGLIKLFFNILKGKMVKLEDAWDGHRSVVGYADPRDDLDESIRQDSDEDERYLVHLSFMAAKLAYEESSIVEHVVSNIWEMKLLQFYNFWDAFQGKYSTKAFVLQTSVTDPDLFLIAFRGTLPFHMMDWCTNVDLSWVGIKGVGKLHGGFTKALGLPLSMEWPKEALSEDIGPSAYYTLRQIMRKKCEENEKAKFIVTGYSSGAALAILFASLLTLHDEAEVLRRIRGVYTFGQPRVGDAEFAKHMTEKLKAHNVLYRRFVYCNDVVPRVPFDDKLFFYKHFGECMYYNSLYKGKVMKEEPHRNYFSLVWMVPIHLNAYWELVRGQLLPLVKGKLYKEGPVPVAFRLIGLVLPGIAAHGPQDYDNVTRLGNTRLKNGYN